MNIEMTEAEKAKIQDELKETFGPCFSAEPQSDKEVYDLDAHQMGAIHWLNGYMDRIYGLTFGDDKTRYITDGIIVIATPAISSSDAWQKTFKNIFTELGDFWVMEPSEPQAKKISKPPMQEEQMVIDAIKSWDEEGEPLEYLSVGVSGLACFKNSENKLVLVNEKSLLLLGALDFSLDNIADPLKSIPLTHCASLGFAGVLFPCQLRTPEKYPEKLLETHALLTAAP